MAGKHYTTRQVMVGATLLVALVSFELLNFDTTEYALENLLDSVSFGGVQWATILAIAFCGIDFAGLVRVLGTRMTTNNHDPESRLNPSWLLLAAWLIGGAMNSARRLVPSPAVAVSAGVINGLLVGLLLWLMPPPADWPTWLQPWNWLAATLA